MKHSLLVVSLCLPLGACWMGRAQTNEPLDAIKAAQLVPGTSKASDVVALLGGPNDVVQLGRRTAYQYIATTEKSAGLWLFALALTNVDARQGGWHAGMALLMRLVLLPESLLFMVSMPCS